MKSLPAWIDAYIRQCARRYARNPSDIDDFIQEGRIAAWLSLRSLNTDAYTPEQVEVFLKRTVNNHLINCAEQTYNTYKARMFHAAIENSGFLENETF